MAEASDKMQALVTKAVAAIQGYVQRALAARICPLEKRLEALEDRPSVKYFGVWSAGNEYRSGSMATHGGSVWHANKTTRSKPGESDHWTLAVKHGRDSKDSR